MRKFSVPGRVASGRLLELLCATASSKTKRKRPRIPYWARINTDSFWYASTASTGILRPRGYMTIPGVDGKLLTGYAYGEYYDWDLYFENLYLSYYGVSDYDFTNLKLFLDKTAT